MLAATDPAVALGVAAISPCVPRLTPGHPNYRRYPSDEPLDTDEGWAKWNVHYWRRDFRGFLEFFFSQQLPEPHSTKQIEDCVRWGLDGGVESLVLADEEAPPPFASDGGGARARRTRPLPGARRPRRARQLPDARARARGGGAHGRDVRRARGRGPHADRRATP